MGLLHFVAFFHVASLLSTGVDNKKVGVENEKALQLCRMRRSVQLWRCSVTFMGYL